MSAPRCNLCEGAEKEKPTNARWTMTWVIPGSGHVDVKQHLRLCNVCERKKADILTREDIT